MITPDLEASTSSEPPCAIGVVETMQCKNVSIKLCFKNGLGNGNSILMKTQKHDLKRRWIWNEDRVVYFYVSKEA